MLFTGTSQSIPLNIPIRRPNIQNDMSCLQAMAGLVIVTRRDSRDRLFSGALISPKLLICYAAKVYDIDVSNLDVRHGEFAEDYNTAYPLHEKYLAQNYHPDNLDISQIAVLEVSHKNFKSFSINHLDVISYCIVCG